MAQVESEPARRPSAADFRAFAADRSIVILSAVEFDQAIKERGARLARAIHGGGLAGHGHNDRESFSGGSGKNRNRTLIGTRVQ
jgi:hypothetical protein